MASKQNADDAWLTPTARELKADVDSGRLTISNTSYNISNSEKKNLTKSTSGVQEYVS